MEALSALWSAHFLDSGRFWFILAAAGLLLLAIVRRRDGIGISLLRFVSLVLLLVALANPVKQEQSESRELTALFDASASVSAVAKRALVSSLKPFLEGAQETKLTIIPFAKTAALKPVTLDGDSSEEDIFDAIESAASDLDRGQTNISAGLFRASASTDSSSILLLSDGRETTGDAQQTAEQLAAQGVSVFPLVPSNSVFTNQSLEINALDAPLTVNSGDRATVRVSVKNSFDAKRSGTLQVWLGKKKLFSKLVALDAESERLVTVTSPPTDGGLQRIRAVLIPEGTDEDKALERHRWISVKEKSKILLIGGAVEDNRVLNRLLRLKGYAIEDLVANGRTTIPTTFDNFSTVILNNVAKKQLPGGFINAFSKFARDGGGAVLIGGERSFGLGGYIDTAVEEMSPVKFVPPRTTKRRLNSAVALVIDKSRSMVFERKIDAAKAAAKTAINALKDEDFVSVIGFDSVPFVIIRMTKVSEAKLLADRRLRNLTPSGKTNLLPALASAHRALRGQKASRKHIIVLSDGKFPLAGSQYVQEVTSLRKSGVTLSAVALGSEADVPFMKMISEYGKGAFYHTLDPTRLPEIFLRDIKVTVGEETMKENQRFSIYSGPDGVQSTRLRNFPHVTGFVETLPKKKANLELITKKEDRVFPVLASWKYGSGTVVAFSSDANGRWSLPWLKWKEFHKFWGHILETVKPKQGEKATETDFDFRYSVNRGNIELDLAVFDEKLATDAPPQIKARITEPGSEVSDAFFRATTKGRFAATIENGRPGDYRIDISYGGVKFPPLAITLPGEVFGEREGQGINLQNLSNLAYATGGSINPSAEQVASTRRISEKSQQLFFPLVIIAFFLILIEAFLRELGSSFLWLLFPQALRSKSIEKQQRGEHDLRKRAA